MRVALVTLTLSGDFPVKSWYTMYAQRGKGQLCVCECIGVTVILTQVYDDSMRVPRMHIKTKSG